MAACEYGYAHMRTLTDAEITDYVARDQPIDCAGAYKIEAGGIALFERIGCSDFTAITGLPLMAVHGYLRSIREPTRD